MIGYYTDNGVSQSVMKHLRRAGIQTMHIRNFKAANDETPIFYGILRGTGAAMRVCQYIGRDYYYMDNGYFDAVYMDLFKRKEMTGKYRIVKNDMLEPYPHNADSGERATKPLALLLLPPSPYSAFMYDTTPEDWNQDWLKVCKRLGYRAVIRDKSEQRPLNKQLQDGYSGVLAFNSIGVMTAIEQGKIAYDTHGILRNANLFGSILPRYDINNIRNFYENKNFTLEEIANRGIECLGTNH